MKIEVVTAWYNEQILAPLFKRHYAFANRIHVLFDVDSDDRTEEYLSGLEVHPIKYPDGIDWVIKSDAVNELSNSLDADWVIAVDADEFVFPKGHHPYDTPFFLQKQEGNVIFCELHNVYRHHSDKDLIDDLPVPQRRHGNPIPGISYGQNQYIKPCVVKPELQIRWTCGIHGFIANDKARVNPINMVGAHWAMADPTIALSRRLAQSKRQSKNNLIHQRGYQNFNITKEEIEKELAEHLNDHLIF